MDTSREDIKGKSLAAIIPPSFHSLRAARAYLDRVADAAGLDEDATYDLKVAVSEAVANAIQHGAPGEAVHLKSEISEGDIKVVVTSEGPLSRQSSPKTSGNRGLGIPVMASLSNEILIEGTRDRTRVTLFFASPRAPRQP